MNDWTEDPQSQLLFSKSAHPDDAFDNYTDAAGADEGNENDGGEDGGEEDAGPPVRVNVYRASPGIADVKTVDVLSQIYDRYVRSKQTTPP